MSDRVEEYDRQLLEYKLAKCRQRADCMNSSSKAFRTMAACRAMASDSKVDEKGSEALCANWRSEVKWFLKQAPEAQVRSLITTSHGTHTLDSQ